MTAFPGVSKSAVNVSYIAAYQIGKKKKSHSIDKKLSNPVMKDVVKIMVGDRESKNSGLVSLLPYTLKRRIVDKSHDVLKQIVSQVNASPFYAIQLDESRYCRSTTAFCIYSIHQQWEVIEELLFCKTLHLYSKCEDIFTIIDGFYNNYFIS